MQALSCAFAVRGLTPSEKLVLLALANFANDKMQCWPSQDRLAADTELSSRTVWGALKALEDRGVLSRVSRKRADGTRSTDVFTLHFAMQVWSEPVADIANSTRNPCENQPQNLQEPVAAFATLTTFDPSTNHQIEPSVLVTQSATARKVDEREEAAWVRFWAAYPRKDAKKAARKAFAKAWRKLPPHDEEAIITGGLERAKASWVDAQFIPHAATWLNGERWNDEPATVTPLRRYGPSLKPDRQTAYVERLGDIDAAMEAAFQPSRGVG